MKDNNKIWNEAIDKAIECFSSFQSPLPNPYGVLKKLNELKKEALKPCPFIKCGGKAQVSIYGEDKRYWIACTGSDGCAAATGLYDTEKEAADFWNTRA